MNNYNSEIIGGIVSAALVTLGLIKIEYIKKMVHEKKTGLKSYLVLFALVAIPIIIGLSIPEEKAITKDDLPMQEKEVVGTEKSDAEVISDGVLTLSEELIRKNEEKKRKERIEDSIKLANREQRWVYIIGDMMSSSRPLEDQFDELRNTEKVCVFKHKGNYFLFREGPLKSQLRDSMAWYEVAIGKEIKIDTIDLFTQCNLKEEIREIKRMTLKHKKKKIEVRCLTCEEAKK